MDSALAARLTADDGHRGRVYGSILETIGQIAAFKRQGLKMSEIAERLAHPEIETAAD